jgi:hypothetical protein
MWAQVLPTMNSRVKRRPRRRGKVVQITGYRHLWVYRVPFEATLETIPEGRPQCLGLWYSFDSFLLEHHFAVGSYLPQDDTSVGGVPLRVTPFRVPESLSRGRFGGIPGWPSWW